MRNISLFYLIKPVALALAVPFASLVTQDHPDPNEPDVEPGSPDFWFHIIVSVGFVILGGVFAGYVLYLTAVILNPKIYNCLITLM